MTALAAPRIQWDYERLSLPLGRLLRALPLGLLALWLILASLLIRPNQAPEIFVPEAHQAPSQTLLQPIENARDFTNPRDGPRRSVYYNRFRHYDPMAGQYMSPDPIGLAGGDRPQGYVQNPAAWIDPLGLQARGPDGKFLPRNGLPGPGSTFEGDVAAAFRAKGDTVYNNVTIRDASGTVISYGDSIVVRNGAVRFVVEAKSGRMSLSPGQRAVQTAIRDGKPLTFTGPNSTGIPGAGQPTTLPSSDGFQHLGPGDPTP